MRAEIAVTVALVAIASPASAQQKTSDREYVAEALSAAPRAIATGAIVTGPHLMIFGPPAKALGYPTSPDPDPSKPYMMWVGTPYEHAMIPLGGGK